MVKIAILGFGVVGSGVAEVLETNSDRIARSAATGMEIKYILDLRDFPESKYSDKFVKDFSVIENDPEVKIVVEAIGGASVAYEFTKRSLLAGKNVVTSNKELVAEHGCELLAIAKEKNLNYLFEASVGGGIPIIRPISQCLAANELDEIYGILNGTSNYVLSQMITGGLSFAAALKQAQEKGYSEADPSADIDGHDACRKTCILASLSFGRHIYPKQVLTEGIRGVTLEDVKYAGCQGYKIKHLGRAIKMPDGKIACYVAPHLVGQGSLLGNVEDVFNGIVVRGNAIGDVMFYGAGAGKLPTASAVVADVIDCAKHFHARKYIDWNEGGEEIASDSELLETQWYVRIPSVNSNELKALFGDVSVIEPPEGVSEGYVAFITEKISHREIQPKVKALGAVSVFRILD